MSTSTSHESKFGGEISSVINCVNLTSSDSDEGSNEVVDSRASPLPAYELIYQERSDALFKELEELQMGKHPKFLKEVENLKLAQNNELMRNKMTMLLECEAVESEYDKTCQIIIEETEQQNQELMKTLEVEQNEKKKAILAEKEMMKLQPDFVDEIPLPTRKIRKRLHNPVVSVSREKRPKLPPSTSSYYLLKDLEIEEDVKAIKDSLNSEESTSKPELLQNCSTDTNPLNIKNSKTAISNIRIESGKLLFDKRWYHRGQPIFVEERTLDKFPAIICSISKDTIWVKNVENSKICINLSCLLTGEISITRRAVF